MLPATLLLALVVSAGALQIVDLPGSGPFPVARYVEGTVATPLCPRSLASSSPPSAPSCTITYAGTAFANTDERIPSGGVVLTIPSGYVFGSDLLSAGSPSGSVDFVVADPSDARTPSVPAHTLTLSWPNDPVPGRKRAAASLSEALRAVTFQARGRDPTDKGRSFSRSVVVTVTDQDGTVATATIPLTVVGRNDAPEVLSPFFAPPPGPPNAPVRTWVEGSPSGVPLFLPAPAAAAPFALVDVDDDHATRAVLTLLGGDPAGDALAFTPGAGAAAAGIAGLWDAAARTLTLAAAGFAPVPLSDLVGALADVTFDASAAGATPRAGTRRVEVRVWDAAVSQPGSPLPPPTPAHALVNVTVVNDAPSLAGLPASPRTYFAGDDEARGVGLFDAASAAALSVSDPDDSSLSSATLSFSAASYVVGEDELFLAPPEDAPTSRHTVPPSLRVSWDASAGALTLAGDAPIPVYLSLLRTVRYRGRRRVNPTTAAPRVVSLTVVDAGSDGQDPSPSNPRKSATVSAAASVTVVRVNQPPTLAPLPGGIRLSLDDGALRGSAVRNGNLVVAATEGEPGDVFTYAVTGGDGAVVVEADPGTGQLRAAIDIDLHAAGPLAGRTSVEVEVTAWDRAMGALDPAAKPSAPRAYTVHLVDLATRPALAPQFAGPSATATLPVYAHPDEDGTAAHRPTMPRFGLLHGRALPLCVDLRRVLTLAGHSGADAAALLVVDIRWLVPPSPSSVSGSAREEARLSDPRLTALFDPADPPRWEDGPVAGVRCLAGTPRLPGGPVNLTTEGAPQSPRATRLDFRLTAFSRRAAEIAGMTLLPVDGSGWDASLLPDPSLLLPFDIAVPVDVPGCRDPRARYVPCYSRGVPTGPAAVSSGLFVDQRACDNECVDADGDGLCDNQCDLPAAPAPAVCANPSASYGGNVYTTAAANPRGNYNPHATATDGVQCVYPFVVLSANVSLGHPTGGGAAAGAAARLVWGESTPPFTPALLATSPWPATTAPGLTAVGLYGLATLRLGRGALSEAAVRALDRRASTPAGGDDAAEPDGVPHTVSARFSLERIEWPRAHPLPSFALTTAGPPPAIDADLMFRLAPATFPLPPASDGAAELCIFAGPAGVASAMAAQADPSKRRYPRIYSVARLAFRPLPATPRAGGTRGPGAVLERPPDQDEVGTAAGEPFDFVPGDDSGMWDGGGGSPASSSSSSSSSFWSELPISVYDPATAKLCTTLGGALPALVAVGWTAVPLGSSGPLATGAALVDGGWGAALPSEPGVGGVTARMTDINTLGGSSPAWLTPYAGRLFFAATSSDKGREVWSLGAPTASPWYAAAHALPDASISALGQTAARVRRPDSLARLSVGSGDGSHSHPVPLPDLAIPGAPGEDADPAHLVVYRGDEAPTPRLYFVARGARGREIWSYDALAGGSDTSYAGAPGAPLPLVDPALPGPARASSPTWLTVYAGSLYWSAEDEVGAESVPGPAAGRPRKELWTYRDTRGTTDAERAPAPIARLRGRWAGGNASTEGDGQPLLSGYTDPTQLAVCGPNMGWSEGGDRPSSSGAAEREGSVLFFSAEEHVGSRDAAAGGLGAVARGRELWALNASSSSSASSTGVPFLVADIFPGASSSSPEDLFCYRGALYFTADDGVSGREVWRVSLLAPLLLPLVPTRVTDISPGPGSAFVAGGQGPASFAVFRGQLLFAADDGGPTGRELWGTGVGRSAAGGGPDFARLLADLDPGPSSSSPSELAVYHGILYFACTLAATGRDLCAYDGTRPPLLVADLDVTAPAAFAGAADGSSNPSSLAVWADRLWFAADDGEDGHGAELMTFHTHPAPTLVGCGGGGNDGDPLAPAPVRTRFEPDGGAVVEQRRVQVGDRSCSIELSVADGSPGDAFGASVAVDRGTAFGWDDGGAGGSSSLALRPWAINGVHVAVDGKVVADERPVGMRGPASSPVRPGGATVVVGAPGVGQGAGAAYVFVAQGAPGEEDDDEVEDEALDAVGRSTVDWVSGPSACGSPGWRLRGVLRAPGGGRGLDASTQPPTLGDAFGTAVAADAGTVVVGSPQANLGAGTRSGAVYVYRRLRDIPRSAGGFPRAHSSFASNQSHFTAPTPLLPASLKEEDGLGGAVGVFADAAVLGAPGRAQGTGTAWLFLRDQRTGAWREARELAPPSGSLVAGDAYGCRVAITQGLIAVSACKAGGGEGRVFLWTWDPVVGNWTVAGSRAVLRPSTTGGGISSSAGFGSSLAAHGAFVAVGAPGYVVSGGGLPATTGAAFLFMADASGLPLSVARVVAGDSEGAGVSAAGASGSAAGVSVGLASVPPSLLVGVPNAGVAGDSAGTALAFEPRSASPLYWALSHGQGGSSGAGADPFPLLRTARLRPLYAGRGDAFGTALAMGGAVAAVGAPGRASGTGAVYVTTCPTSPCSGAGTFTARLCTPAHDRACGRCARGRCPRGFFESSPCSSHADRVCTACSASPCPPGEKVLRPCSAAADRVCGRAAGAGALDGTMAAGMQLDDGDAWEDEGGVELRPDAGDCVAAGMCGREEW
jgi:ELWxxDGT repeat protein